MAKEVLDEIIHINPNECNILEERRLKSQEILISPWGSDKNLSLISGANFHKIDTGQFEPQEPRSGALDDNQVKSLSSLTL